MNEHQRKLKQLNKLNKRRNIQSVDKDGFIDFINKSLLDKSREEKQVNIGKTSENAQKRIETLVGQKITNIDINKGGVRHALNKEAHNLKPKDLLHAEDVINNADDTSLSNEKHQDCDVIIFKKDKNGEITFLTEVHAPKDHLLVFDAWRKRAERSADAVLANPPGLTSETNLSPAVTNNIPQNNDNVKEKKE